MNKEEVKTFLVEKIVGLQGIKATELFSLPEVAVDLREFNIIDLMDELIGEGRIVEIEYALPEMNWRLKSFYLPAGTRVKINR
jgi:hypothetical protein